MIGFASGTSNERNVTSKSQHGVTTTNTSRRSEAGHVIGLAQFADTNRQMLAELVSFNADNCILNFITVPAEAKLFTIIFFAGDDLTAHVGAIAHTTEDSAVDITGVGFEPDLLILGYDFNFLTGNNVYMGYGACANDGSASQKSFGTYSVDNLATSDVQTFMRSAHAATLGRTDAGLLISDFDSDGFSATVKLSTLWETGDSMFLALNFGGKASASFRTCSFFR